MKLLFSLGIFYPSQVGGPGNTLYWIGKELVKKGVKVTSIVSDKGVAEDFAPRGQWFDLDGIKIKYCRVKSANNSIKLALLSIKEITNNDVVILSSLFYKPNFFVGLAALLFQKKIIWSPRGELLVSRGIIKRIYLKIVKTIFSRKVIFHATSSEEEESIFQLMGCNAKCVIVPNYMELPAKVEATSNERYLLYVGRIMPIKALDNLIEGITFSKQFKEKDYKLYLAGKNEGNYYKHLLKLINEKGLTERVKFKGMVEGEDKETLYAGAKATLLVSNSENFGNVIIESLAQGTPAITSIGTPWQVLETTNSGFWIDNSPEAIGKTIDKLLELPEEDYRMMRQNAYKLCRDKFDIKNNINSWLNVICKKNKQN